MEKYIIALFLIALNVKAAPGAIHIRNTTGADVPVLVFLGPNCEDDRLRSFMDKHRLSPIDNGDPLKAWASVQWAKVQDLFTPASKDPLKRQPNAQCRYIGQGFLGVTNYTTRDTFAKLDYTDISEVPSYKKSTTLLALKGKIFKLPYTHTAEGKPYPVKIVFYAQPSAMHAAVDKKKITYTSTIHVCDALPDQEVVIEEGIAGKLKCTVK